MDPVDLLHRRLTDAASTAHPAGATLTIAEVYQQLIPYRAIRSDLGLTELAQYEHALLRLLSGERGYIRIDPPQVQDEIRRELQSPNPILGIYRDYAGVEIVLDSSPLPHLPTDSENAGKPAAVPPHTPSPEPAREPEPPPVPVATATDRPSDRGDCKRCGSSLPDDRSGKYCPECGSAQRPLPCVECGGMIEPEWKFCTDCGRAARGE
ncbi:MAG TPA: zinc ribbon domain-containing protein [Longimicrobiaceae bacterium]|nr:zinc ribbon domain-containing protein [Longimicrobiaceae bacterium]